jgi:hypothetical protein
MLAAALYQHSGARKKSTRGFGLGRCKQQGDNIVVGVERRLTERANEWRKQVIESLFSRVYTRRMGVGLAEFKRIPLLMAFPSFPAQRCRSRSF